MSDLVLALRQARYENRIFWRNPPAAFFTFAFPLMFLVIFNLIFQSGTVGAFGRTINGSEFYIPAITAFSVITACYTNLAMNVSVARDRGRLKRVRGTPLPMWAYVFGKIASSVILAVLLVVIVLVVGMLFYGVSLPGKTLPQFSISLAVGAAAFCCLGMAISGFVPNEDAAPAVVNFSILPLLFISNIFVPMNGAPDWLSTLAGVFPPQHFAKALVLSFDPAAGGGFRWTDLGIVALWGVVGIALAGWKFSWEPRR
jgi:ABC-2 type transport system permease protein